LVGIICVYFLAGSVFEPKMLPRNDVSFFGFSTLDEDNSLTAEDESTIGSTVGVIGSVNDGSTMGDSVGGSTTIGSTAGDDSTLGSFFAFDLSTLGTDSFDPKILPIKDVGFGFASLVFFNFLVLVRFFTATCFKSLSNWPVVIQTLCEPVGQDFPPFKSFFLLFFFFDDGIYILYAFILPLNIGFTAIVKRPRVPTFVSPRILFEA
jgi:hypothetical protein